MIRQASTILFAAFFLSSCCTQKPSPARQLFGDEATIRRFTESAVAYDLGRIISKSEFTDSTLTYLFHRFASQQRAKHRVSRLALAFDEEDLQTEYPYQHFFANPKDSEAQFGTTHHLAEVLCIDGNASAFIKRGLKVKFLQILGDRDPRVIKLSPDVDARIVSFQINHPDLEELSNFPNASPGDSIKFYVFLSRLPSLEEANRIWEHLQSVAGTYRAFAVIRSDTAFAGEGGPITDVFHLPLMDVPSAVYYSRQDIWCAGGTPPCEIAIPKRRTPGFPM